MANDLEAVESDLPFVFTWNSTSYTGSRTETNESEPLEIGGFIQDYDFQVICRQEIFATLPDEGATFISGGISYKVVRARKDQASVGITFDVQSVNR